MSYKGSRWKLLLLKLACQILRVEDGQQIRCDEVGRIDSLAALRVQRILQRRKRAD